MDKQICTIKVFTGKIFPVLEPNPDLVDIRDIAHALSNQCRFSGHTAKFYSVAEHSVRVSREVSPENALCALLHDATEAYLVDMPRPIKYASELGKHYKAIEAKLWLALSKRFAVPEEMPEEIHLADAKMLRTEMRDLMGGVYGKFTQREGYSMEPTSNPDCYEGIIYPMPPHKAEEKFLKRFEQLGGTIGTTD